MSWALSAKVVLLTGAASGIGRATMISLLECEATVFAVDLKPNLGYSHPNLYYFNGNLTEEGIIARVVQDCIQKFGKIDALLNVAGIMDTANSVDTLTNLSWEKHLQVNLTVPVYLMREVVPHMLKARGGSIVNVASKAGISGAAAGVAYTASKHGLVGSTKNVAWRFKANGIRCNAICPGGVQTNITQSINLDDIDHEAHATIQPVIDLHLDQASGTTIAKAELLANVLLFLVSDMSKEISGAIIPVDHAWSTI